MAQPIPCDSSNPKMDGEVNAFVLSSMWPWLVPAQANARLGIVSVGAEANQASHTAYPRARADSTGSACGVKQPMMSPAVVPGRIDQPDFDSQASVCA